MCLKYYLKIPPPSSGDGLQRPVAKIVKRSLCLSQVPSTAYESPQTCLLLWSVSSATALTLLPFPLRGTRVFQSLPSQPLF